MKNIIIVALTFILTTMFWFAVPSVDRAINGGDEALVSAVNQLKQEIYLLNQDVLAMKKEISSMPKTKTAAISAPVQKKTETAPVQNTAPKQQVVTKNEPQTAQKTEEDNSLSIAGTWVYDDPQTPEERNTQLIFNAYGNYKIYRKDYGFTTTNDNYTISSGNRILMNYSNGSFKLTKVGQTEYLELFNIRDFSGKFKRIK